MGPQIAHTLVSFEFKNQQPLVFRSKFEKKRPKSFQQLAASLENMN